MTTAVRRAAPWPFFSLVAVVSGAATLVCAAALVWGWFTYHNWNWPGWTVGQTFGIGPTTFATNAYLQTLAERIAPHNPGWIFLAVAWLSTWRSSARRELGR